MRVESGLDLVNTFHMSKLTQDIKAGRTYSRPWVDSGSKMVDCGAMWRDVEVKALEVWSGELYDAGSTCGSILEQNSVPDDFWHVGTTRYPSHGEAV